MKKLFIITLFGFIALCREYEAYAAMPKFDEAVLKALAEDDGYGYKYANLAELEKLVKHFNTIPGRRSLKVQVPEFFGISSKLVVAALLKKDFDIVKKWKEVILTLSPDIQEKALSEKKIPDIFWNAQKNFIAQLELAFSNLLNEANPFNFNEADLSQLQRLLDLARDDALMVRSTGKEDTRAMANAGGNTSVPNVRPTIDAIVNAAKDVVSSYFGEKSLEQRLGLGDKTLFSPEVFCPVLIQRMIGEKKGGEIPACGVMFTEEAEGGISYKNELKDGHVVTTGITMIQAAYGHNEGVVNSLVAFDTVVAQDIDGLPVFYPTIRNKNRRLVPSDAGLVPKSNHSRMALTPALSKEVLLALKQLADALESYYGYPMDVEFVVRDNVVWLVQARPIVHKEGRVAPCYLDQKYLSGLQKNVPNDILKGRTIGAFGGTLVSVDDKAQCIVGDRIGGALASYLKSDRDVIKCIFSGTDAPATSHEATTFRSEGKPVMYAFDVAGVRKALDNGKKLVFSPQQHCIVVMNKDEKPVTKSGWCAYPLPQELSLTYVLSLMGVPDMAAKGPLVSKRGREDREQENVNSVTSGIDLKKHSLHDLLNVMKLDKNDDEKAQEKALEAAKIFPDKLASVLDQAGKSVKLDDDLKKQMSILVQASAELCRRIAWLWENDASLIVRLLPINYLEALVHQQLRGEERALKFFSVETVLSALKGERVDATKLVVAFGSVETKALHTQLVKASSMGFAEITQQSWKKLIDGLAGSVDVQPLQNLGLLVKKLDSFDILPLWFNAIMVNDVKQLGSSATLDDYVGLVKSWVTTMEQSGESFALIKQLREEVKGFNVNNFGDPKKFRGAWESFEQLLLKFKDISFTSVVRGDQKLSAMAACTLMNAFIELFDTGIKAMKGSRLWKKEEQPKVFQEMLKEYFDLYIDWSKWVPAAQFGHTPTAKTFGGDVIVVSPLNLVDGCINKGIISIKDLEPTLHFSATAATFGSGANISNVQQDKTLIPQTLEDGFTVIHQSLLFIVASLTSKLIKASLVKPDFIQRVEFELFQMEKLLLGRDIQAKCSLVGINISSVGIDFHYNVPMRNHSGKFIIYFNKKTQTTDLKMQIYGHHPERWYKIGAFIFLWSSCKSISLIKDLQVSDMEISCKLHIPGMSKGDLMDVRGFSQKCIFPVIKSTFDVESLNYSFLGEIENEIEIDNYVAKNTKLALVIYRILIGKNYNKAVQLGYQIALNEAKNTDPITISLIMDLLTELIKKKHEASYDLAITLVRQHHKILDWGVVEKLFNIIIVDKKDIELIKRLIEDDIYVWQLNLLLY